MRNRAAVCFGEGQGWQIVETELDPPAPGEVMVRLHVAGMCHTDDHKATGPMNNHDPEHGIVLYPFIGGHEGAGVVEAVGEGVTSVVPGDHVVMCWINACGRCRMCASGQQFLCDSGLMSQQPDIAASQARNHLDGEPIYSFGQGTFAERLVADEGFVIKIEPDIPFDVAALVGCGVTTGFGSAVERAEVVAGDVVVVVGIGGLGAAAVQAAHLSGARFVVAVDPVEFKREKAFELGATHTSHSMEEALSLVNDISWGMLADKVIVTVGVLAGEHVQAALALTRKGGTCVVSSVAAMGHHDVDMDLFTFVLSQKTLKGSLYGGCSPRAEIPRILHLHRSGRIDVPAMITRRYSLSEVNLGYQHMMEGRNIRGVIDIVGEPTADAGEHA